MGDRLVGKLFGALSPLQAPRCVLHGDAHGENLPARRSGGICMLDWQDRSLGSRGIDLADFLVMSFPVGRRATLQSAFIAQHARLFARPGYDATLDDRRGTLQRLARVVIGAHEFPGWAATSLPWVFARCASGVLDAEPAGLL